MHMNAFIQYFENLQHHPAHPHDSDNDDEAMALRDNCQYTNIILPVMIS